MLSFLMTIISNYQCEILVLIGSLFSIFFEREHLDSFTEKLVYLVIGLVGASIIYPLIIEFAGIDTSRINLMRAIAFFLGVFTTSFIGVVKRSLDNADFWEFIKGKFGG